MITLKEKILRYIRDYINQHGYSPSVREIGQGVGLQSSSSVKEWLDKLSGSGDITWVANKPRTITVAMREGEERVVGGVAYDVVRDTGTGTLYLQSKLFKGA